MARGAEEAELSVAGITPKLSMPSAPRCIILASLLGFGQPDPERPPHVSSGELHGRVLLPDGGSPAGLHTRVRSGAALTSAAVTADGTFILGLVGIVCDSVEIEVNTSPDSPPRYHPVVARVAMAASGAPEPGGRDGTGPPPLYWERGPRAPDSIRIVLVPTSFTIDAGTYAGQTIPIAIDESFPGSRQRGRFWRFSQSAPAIGTPVAWPESALPLRIAIDAGKGGAAASDTAAFWRLARQLERDIGRPLFRPAPLTPSDESLGHVVVRIGDEAPAAAITFVAWDNWGTLYDASIDLRSMAFLRDERIVTHELLHALGVGHARSWLSVMSSGAHAQARATPEDVAHTQLLYRLRRLHIDGRATHGIADLVRRGTDTGEIEATGCGSAARAMTPSP